MASTADSKTSHGTKGNGQIAFEENEYKELVQNNEITHPPKDLYVPSPKHEPNHNWGSENPIKTLEEGQQLLDTGYRAGNQVYNITKEGKLVKFQRDGTPQNGYHSYEIMGFPDIPTNVLRQMEKDNLITHHQYLNYLKGRKK